eukprot:NODE_469_length_7049_cov_0.468489.p4 type:complete len:262 gc:universal NODE_469_length_7049_cov_0.468489:2806-3591(+)
MLTRICRELQLRTLQKIIAKFPEEPRFDEYKEIQNIYSSQSWPSKSEISKLRINKDLIVDLEMKGLYKSSAVCRFYSHDIVDQAKLVETGYVWNVLDSIDIKDCLPDLVKNQTNKFCSYVLGCMLVHKKTEAALEKLEFAADEVPKARSLYFQTLFNLNPQKAKPLILKFLDKTSVWTAEDRFYHYIVVENEDLSLKSLVTAAEMGLMEAQYNLGCLYLEGKLNGGVKQAQSWFYLAAIQGYKPAKHNLEKYLVGFSNVHK